MSSRYRVVTLTYGEPEYGVRLAQVSGDVELVARMWADAESRPVELAEPGTRWTIALADDGHGEMPAAWCAAREVVEDGRPVLKGLCNYEVPGWRGHGLYLAAYRERHRRVIRTSSLPAVTYLFAHPIGLHLGDGWHHTGLTGPGELSDHQWWELRRNPTG